MSQSSPTIEDRIKDIKSNNNFYLTSELFKKIKIQYPTFRRDLVNERIPASILRIKHLNGLPVTAENFVWPGTYALGTFIGYIDILNPKNKKTVTVPLVYQSSSVWTPVDPLTMSFTLHTGVSDSIYSLLYNYLNHKYRLGFAAPKMGDEAESAAFIIGQSKNYIIALIITSTQAPGTLIKDDTYKLRNAASDVSFHLGVQFTDSSAVRYFLTTDTGGSKLTRSNRRVLPDTPKYSAKISPEHQPIAAKSVNNKYIEVTPALSYNDFSVAYGPNSIDRVDYILEYCRQKHYLPTEKGTYTEGSTTSRGMILFPSTNQGKFNQNVINDKVSFDTIRKKFLNLIIGLGVDVIKVDGVEFVFYDNSFYRDFFKLLAVPTKRIGIDASQYDDSGKAHKAMILRFISPPFFMQMGDEMIHPAFAYMKYQLATSYAAPEGTNPKEMTGRQKRGAIEFQTFEGALDTVLKLNGLSPEDIARILYLATF